MSKQKEPRYTILESELMSFHMAAVLQMGDNKLAQDIVGGIRSRKISQNNIERNDSAIAKNNKAMFQWHSYFVNHGQRCIIYFAL